MPESFRLPAHANFGGTSGIAFNSKGNIFVIHRGPMPLMEFDPDGHFIRGFGDGLFERPHGLRIDAEDNIWATDVAGHVVYKFNPAGRLEMVLGCKSRPGEWHEFGHLRLFNEPNEAVVGPTGDLFVLQGHGKGKSLILKFDKRRQLHQDLGQEGQGPGRVRPAAFAGVRRQGPALHRRPQQRAHPGVRRRRQLHPRVEASRHAVRAVHDADQTIWLAHGHTGQIMTLDLNGNVLGQMAGAGNGKTLGKYGEAHYIAVSPRGEVFVADTLNWRVQKYVKKEA